MGCRIKDLTKIMQSMRGFDLVAKNLNFLEAGAGKCLCSLKLEMEHINIFNGIHGGMSATLVDMVSNAALLTHAMGNRPSISVKIDVCYIKPALLGDTILINAETLKIGKKLSFLDVTLRNAETKELLAKGHHVKSFFGPSTVTLI